MTEKILSREALAAVLESRRQRGERIVFTNGCFDILHVGHARYLAQARALGDLLVVGLNSDRSVQALKGSRRPLVPEDERAEMLAHLECVDYVSIFDEDRPDALIEVVQPAIHVKGGDYREEDLPEAAVVRKHGGRVVIMPLVEGRSTTNIITRILEAYRE
ncbi:MAG TPA: D-glycero-beta-D-manno-heptose 1-phosphate adenylyltransferase [Chthonomonadales bacterium]|nr:D-glycero-beta-D-manno-heptose 1-phosphate adenylyltransferase [Chthonomonadales bacterium]